MNDLEELAHHSAASARASVADLPIPPTPGHSKSRPGLRAGLVIAASIAAITGLIHFSADGAAPADVAGGLDTTQSGSSPADSIPYFEFAEIPDGWILSVSDGPVNPTGAELTSATQAYGAGTAENPFADADLMIGIEETPSAVEFGQAVSDELLVRGHLAERSPTASGADLGNVFRSVAWAERPDLVIFLQSRHYEVDDLVRIADSLSVDGPDVKLPNPPDGMSLISSVATAAVGPWTMIIADPESDSRLILGNPTQGTGFLELVRYTNPNARDVTVRGTVGVLGPMGPDQEPQAVESVQWIENSQVMSLIAVGSGDPVAIANSLRRIDRARFEELLAANPTSNTPTTMRPYAITSDPEGPPGPAVTIAVP